MSLNLDKTTWTLCRLGDVVAASKERVDPLSGEVDRFVAGDHMDTDDLKIHRWGDVNDGYLGPAFHRRFRPGQVLYGSRRTYLRKVAVADFDGITANTTLVLETKGESVLLQEFLPFILSSEPFHAFSIRESKGSVNPYVNWSDLERYEFLLPPLDEQQRLADLLWAVERDRLGLRESICSLQAVRSAHLHARMEAISTTAGTVFLESVIEQGRPITYGILMPGNGVENGIPVVKVKDFPDGEIVEGNLLLTSPEIAHEYRRSTLNEGDLLISIRGTVGRIAEVPSSLRGANITQDTARLSISSIHNRQYIRLTLESGFVQSQIRRHTTGLAVKGLNIGALRKIEIPIPQDPLDEETLVMESRSISTGIERATCSLTAIENVKSSLCFAIFGGAA